MIKKVTIRNFESHEDSEIEFTDGFNLIIGDSNQGKSSIVRAIALAAANRFDKDCVRTGAEFCYVKVETENGYVEIERGENINHWVIETSSYKKEYQSIGATVPPEVLNVLGMGERVRGEIKELPNIMFQLEKHYMLSEIDGKKATANTIARMMDEAIGIGGMEELIKDIATDFASIKKDLGSKNIQISELRSQILDESIFEDCRKAVDSAKDSMKEVESLTTLLESAQTISDKLAKNKQNLEAINLELALSDGLEELYDGVKKDLDKFRFLSFAIENRSELASIDLRLSLAEGIEVFEQLISDDLNKFSLLQKAQQNRILFNEIASKIPEAFDFDAEVEKIEKEQDFIEESERLLRDARGLYKKIHGFSGRFIQDEKELKDFEDKFSEMKQQLGICPLCEREL